MVVFFNTKMSSRLKHARTFYQQRFLISLLFTLCLLNTFSANSHASFDYSTITQDQPSFLPVDEAFIFDNNITQSGIQVRWEIADDYYLYQSKIELKSLDNNAIIGTPSYSDLGIEEEDPYFGITRVVYNTLQVDLPLTLKEGQSDSEIQVTYQGCAVAGLCYPPQKRTILWMPSEDNAANPSNTNVASSETSNNAASDATKSTNKTSLNAGDASSIFNFMSDSSLAALIAIFFVLGLGLTFTPCVLPMVPIVTSIVAGPGAKDLGFAKSFSLALSYVLGMALTYASLGLAMGLLGAGANLQAAMQSPPVLIIFAIVFVALALSMFGLYELQLPSFVRDKLEGESRKLSGGKLLSVFFIGALSAILVSPCVSAPLAGALLYISTSGDPLIGFASLLSLGLGMGVPLILVAVGGAKFLPKTGNWMNTSKFLFGVLLLAVAIWLIARIIPEPVSLALWALLSLATAVFMGAFEPAVSGVQKLVKTIAVAIFLVAGIWFVGAFTGAGDPLRPLEKLTNSASSANSSVAEKINFKIVTNLDELEKELIAANAFGKKAFVDVYADWCISCVMMERNVFPQPEIRSLLGQFYLIKADVTENTVGNLALLEQFKLFGPPSYLFFDQDGKELSQQRIVGEISQSSFKDRLESALAAN